MTITTAKDKALQRDGVDPSAIRIGKDVIEIITTGMYVSPITVYREYIQNAADSFDVARSRGLLGPQERGRVSIAFDHSARSVTIRDNGAGISSRDVLSVLLAIGGSHKRGTQARGFRGVGRLSGLAYCRELEFRTKTSGEKKITSVSWDCRLLRERLADAAFDADLKRIISDVVFLSYETATDPQDHFFEVRLHEVSRLRSDMLLNERLISHYLGQVGPVPFGQDFSFGKEIDERLQAYDVRVPIDLSVDGQSVLRPYLDETIFPATAHKLRIENIEYREFPDVDGGVGAVAWIAHHEYVRSIPPTLGIRGLRARFGDLQVGEANLFDDSFKESRFNGWTVGEIHILDRRVVPNARRDNFELNHHFSNLLVQLGPVAASITQRCRTSSVSRNAAQIVKNVIEEVSARLKQKRSYDRAELSRLKSSVIRARAKSKRITDEKVKGQYESKLDRLRASLAKVTPKRGASAVAFDEASSLVSRLITNREQAERLIQELRRLCD
jgi:hypothetical protein